MAVIPTSSSSFTILAVSLTGILAITLLLLLVYHLFISTSLLTTTTHFADSPLPHQTAPTRDRGLDHATIRRIPTFRYHQPAASTDSECAVCLSEFRDGERLRMLPSCRHAFHIDCIDAWLQATANCPLCRADIVVCGSSFPPPTHHVRVDIPQLQVTDHSNAAVSLSPGVMSCTGDEQGVKAQHPSPMRRSFSMDSSTDKQLYLALQTLQRQRHRSAATDILVDVDEKEEQTTRSSSSRRLRRSFFSFSHRRSSSTAAILPV